MTKPTEPGRGRELGRIEQGWGVHPEPHRPEQASGPGVPVRLELVESVRHDCRATLARGGRATLGRLSDAAKIAEQVNPGRVVYVAVVEDVEGVPCEIAADYQSVLIGPYRFPRDRMPELWAAIGEAAWLAGTIEQAIREEDAPDDQT